VLALREIAEKTCPANDMREGLIHSMQENVEVDEPEAAAAPILPSDLRPTLGRDDPSLDTKIDTMSEDALLRGMKSLVPEEPSVSLDNARSSRAFRRFERAEDEDQREVPSSFVEAFSETSRMSKEEFPEELARTKFQRSLLEMEPAAAELVEAGDALFRNGEPADPALRPRYRLYKRVQAALALPAGPEREAALQAARVDDDGTH
jgi:hypothetical protein